VSAPQLKIRVKRDGRVCILRVSGELDIATAPAFAAQVALALEVPPARFVLDLAGLEFADCCGARALAAAARSVPPDCPVVVCSVNRRVRQVLDVLGLRLERGGTEAVSRAAWLVLESEVLRSWARDIRADTRKLIAEVRSCQAGPQEGGRPDGALRVRLARLTSLPGARSRAR
jgi:anti-sigma B factor antagonist